MIRTIRIIIISLLIFSSGVVMASNAYDFSFESIDSKTEINLSSYKGKVLLIVNTASKCGFTKQYGPLEELYQKYKDRGFEIIAVPSNDFFSQEPGSNSEIKNFCETKFGISFLIAAKLKVKGKDAHPFFLWLKENHEVKPGWNFNKFLIGKDGEFIEHFGSRLDPLSEDIAKQIENHL
jgi:glutathione peroxidase